MTPSELDAARAAPKDAGFFSRHKRKLVFGAGFVISAFFLYKIYQQIDFADLGAALQSFNLLWLIPCLFTFYISMYLRAARWALFFRPTHQLDGRRMWRPIMIGFAFNSIMPGRVGEFARAVYVGRNEKTGIPVALATVFTERLFDGVIILTFLGISLTMLPPIAPETTIEFWDFTLTGANLSAAIRTIVAGTSVIVIGVGAFMFRPVPMFFAELTDQMKFLPAKLRRGLIMLIEGVSQGLEGVRDLKTFAIIAVYSVVLWLLVALSNLILSYGFAGVSMNFTHSVAMMTLIAVFIVIPAAPGYWGLFEAGVLFSATVMNLHEDDSVIIAYALVMHLVQYVPIVVVGLFYAAQSQVRLRPGAVQVPGATGAKD